MPSEKMKKINSDSKPTITAILQIVYKCIAYIFTDVLINTDTALTEGLCPKHQLLSFTFFVVVFS